MNPLMYSMEDWQVKRLYRQSMRRHRRGEIGALRMAAECRVEIAKRLAFRRWLSWNGSRLPY